MPVARVDVAIPCYRYGAMLPTAVRSVLDQEGVDVRVLVIDDASGDGSAEVAQELAAVDSRVDVLVHETNRGHIATFNDGVEWASAEYTMLLSADDVLTPGALHRAAELLDANPDVGLVYGAAISWYGEVPLPAARTENPGWVIYSGTDWLRRRFALGMNCVSSPAAIVRTAVQQSSGGYDAECLHTSDLEMWMRLALHGDVGFLSRVDQAYCREHESNMSVAYEDADGGVGDLRMRMRAFATVLRKAGDKAPADAQRMDRTVRRRLAGDALQRVARAYDKGQLDARHRELLLAFAEETVGGDLTSLPEWHALRVRQLIGPSLAPKLRPLVVTAAGRRVRQEWRSRRLVRRGV